MKRDYTKYTIEEIASLPYMQGKFAMICKTLNISGAQLAKMCDRSPNFMSSIGDFTTTQTIANLKRSIPNISLNWLIMNEGEMFEDRDSSIVAPVDVLKLRDQLEEMQKEIDRIKNAI